MIGLVWLTNWAAVVGIWKYVLLRTIEKVVKQIRVNHLGPTKKNLKICKTGKIIVLRIHIHMGKKGKSTFYSHYDPSIKYTVILECNPNIECFYIMGKVMIHNFYTSLTSDLHPKKSNSLNLLVPTWLFASILL